MKQQGSNFPLFTARVEDYQRKMMKKKAVIRYVIRVSISLPKGSTKGSTPEQYSYCITRRFSEFSELQHALKRCKTVFQSTGIILPSLPSKTILSKTYNKDFLSHRRQHLDIYVINLLNIFNQVGCLEKAANLKELDSDWREWVGVRDAILGFLDVESSQISHFFVSEEYVSQVIIYKAIRDEKIKIKQSLHQYSKAMKEYQQKRFHNSQSLMQEEKQLHNQHVTAHRKLKRDLTELRLLGDAFPVRMNNSSQILNVSRHSIIYIYPISHDEVNYQNLQSSDTVEYELFEASRGKKIYFGIQDIQEVQRCENTFKGSSMESMKISLYSGLHFFIQSNERQEFEEIIKEHKLRYHRHRSRLQQHLLALLDLKKTAYSKKNHAHQLQELWSNVNPDEELLGLQSEQWVKLGFQGKNPVSDFRSVGVLSLHGLLYFSQRYSKDFKELCSRVEYPCSTAGINILHHLIKMLPSEESFDDDWIDNDLFHFLAHMFQHSNFPFEEFFCFTLKLVDGIFQERNATYFQFNEVLEYTISQISEALKKKPFTLQTLEAFLEYI